MLLLCVALTITSRPARDGSGKPTAKGWQVWKGEDLERTARPEASEGGRQAKQVSRLVEW
jgi:hypothetical protein